ncbi:MAG: ABC transporter, partial [bacterium]
GAQKVLLTNEQVAAIREFRLEEQTTSRALREVHKVLRQDIETLAATLRYSNLLAVPFLVAIAGFFTIFRRSQRRGGKP